MTEPKNVNLFSCRFDLVSQDQAVEQCLAWCRGETRGHTLMTINASILTLMRRNPELKLACSAGDLNVADGTAVVWASILLRAPIPERIAGVDLMTRLLDVASRHHFKVFFLGARENVVRSLVKHCADCYPGLVVAGFHNGYFQKEDQSEIIEEIRASRPDILFIGMPSPFKETWGQAHREELCAKLIMGVGGSFDVIGGFIRRAPMWMQKTGMEWFWRLLMEPRKLWKRYLVSNCTFLLMICREIALSRLKRDSKTNADQL